MQKICLDSCALFFMIKYNEAYNRGGLKAVDKLLNQNEKRIKDYKENLLNAMTPEYLEKNKDKSFEDKLEFYKEYANKIKKGAIRDIEKYEKNAEGYFYDKKGQLHYHENTPHKREMFLEFKAQQESLLEFVEKSDKYFTRAKRNYKLLIDKNLMGQIYKGFLEGKYEFYITPTAYAEILNHSADKDSASDKGKVKFSKNKLDAMLKRCSILTMSDKEISDKVDEISKAFRTKRDSDTKAMSRHKNSLGVYGDSMIMAEASLAGINLLTLNLKDFIRDKSIKQDNQRKRLHISKIEKEY